MLSKKEVKDIQSLSLKKNRDETKLFVAEGPKIAGELVSLVPGMIQGIFALEAWIKDQPSFPKGLRVESIPVEVLEKISGLKTPNQVVVVLDQFPVQEPDLAGWALYLDTIQDPGNLGTIIRTADWFGIKNIICSKGCADMYNPKVVQSTMASIARVKVFYDEEDSWLSKQNLPVYAASLHGKPVSEISKTGKGILMIGNESKGIRDDFMKLATEKITISRKGEAESLNAAVATGILLSQLLP
jgi:RNA methyltransferase, TrmH family